MTKSAAEQYEEAKEINYEYCANNYIIDVNKRGKEKQLTDEGFELKEPKFTR